LGKLVKADDGGRQKKRWCSGPSLLERLVRVQPTHHNGRLLSSRWSDDSGGADKQTALQSQYRGDTSGHLDPDLLTKECWQSQVLASHTRRLSGCSLVGTSYDGLKNLLRVKRAR